MHREQFSALIPSLRPALTVAALGFTRDHDDADDLVQETLIIAADIVGRFEPDPDRLHSGLVAWLAGIMRKAAKTERRAAAQRPNTVPLVEARHLVSPPDPNPYPLTLSPSHPLVAGLPPDRALLVRLWLRGYSQVEIGQMHRLHRNTVGNRLELAFEAMGRRIPRADELAYSFSLINACSRVTIYRRPSSVSRWWSGHHPSGINIRAMVRRQERENAAEDVGIPDRVDQSRGRQRRVPTGRRFYAAEAPTRYTHHAPRITSHESTEPAL